MNDFNYAVIGTQMAGDGSAGRLQYTHLAQFKRRIHAENYLRASGAPGESAVLRCTPETAVAVCRLLNDDLPPPCG